MKTVVCLSPGGTPCSRRYSPIRAFFAVTGKVPWPRSVPLTCVSWPLGASRPQRLSSKLDAVSAWPSSSSGGPAIVASTMPRCARWPPDTQHGVGSHRAGMPENTFAPRPSICCAASAVYALYPRAFRTATKPCCASSSRCSTIGAGCPKPPASRRDGRSRSSSTTSSSGVGPGDDPSRRCRCVLSAHGVAVEPPFAEPFRQLLARVVGVLREAGLRTARSRKGSPRTTHLPPRDAADGSNLANRREHARGDQRRRPDIDQRPRDHPAVVGLRSPLRRGSPAAPRRYRLAGKTGSVLSDPRAAGTTMHPWWPRSVMRSRATCARQDPVRPAGSCS